MLQHKDTPEKCAFLNSLWICIEFSFFSSFCETLNSFDLFNFHYLKTSSFGFALFRSVYLNVDTNFKYYTVATCSTHQTEIGIKLQCHRCKKKNCKIIFQPISEQLFVSIYRRCGEMGKKGDFQLATASRCRDRTERTSIDTLRSLQHKFVFFFSESKTNGILSDKLISWVITN